MVEWPKATNKADRDPPAPRARARTGYRYLQDDRLRGGKASVPVRTRQGKGLCSAWRGHGLHPRFGGGMVSYGGGGYLSDIFHVITREYTLAHSTAVRCSPSIHEKMIRGIW